MFGEKKMSNIRKCLADRAEFACENNMMQVNVLTCENTVHPNLPRQWILKEALHVLTQQCLHGADNVKRIEEGPSQGSRRVFHQESGHEETCNQPFSQSQTRSAVLDCPDTSKAAASKSRNNSSTPGQTNRMGSPESSRER